MVAAHSSTRWRAGAGALEKCRRELCGLARVEPIEASYVPGLNRVPRNGAPVLVLFLGSTLGNFDARCRGDFLRQVRARLREGDAMLVGCDLVKPVATMIEAYDDPSGVTASFNLNLLGRINRELDGNFDLRAFEHQARWNEPGRRIEMHLRSKLYQIVSIKKSDLIVDFVPNETICTEACHKFRPEQICVLARTTGFQVNAQWIDGEWPFAETLLVAS